ncbi:serine hydrolase domain-containing protein [Altererythrobacter ishigakiensis]|uniref:CubicO group peptidase (Beta-lactamase class C family) n=1 Tax=Altererythrobacter ishigakiensis TaxID=476157 RepID=A0A562UXN8_9SPHN|nr:serine hydrolase [Altererythrobacter ishigakiensis]TWJ10356.1 CubicO group peptidase (beta-lactamase class C family) [Altererythrobacter ishigakiensis]
MIRTSFGALALLAAIPFVAPANAQSAQEQLDARYDRALAAGYKALFLCSAIANAEANGATRTPESVHEWELTGIQSPLNEIVKELPYEILRAQEAGTIDQVRVSWADDMPPRLARYQPKFGCDLLPIGSPLLDPREPLEVIVARDTREITTDEAALDEAVSRRLSSMAFAGGYGEGSRTTSILVAKGDQIVLEDYVEGFDPSTPQRTWSVAKSIAATLVGWAVQAGEVTVDQPVALGYWRTQDDPRRSITVDHMLRMASGRYSDTPGNRTDPLYWGGATVDESATAWPIIFQPGSVYRYANNDTLMAVKAIQSYLSYYRPMDFFEKLGMNHTVAETDHRGGYILSSQAWTTARDLAKLGQLYLNDGVSPDGERLLPEEWRNYVSDPSGPQPEGTDWGYGAGWWTFRRPEGNAFEGIPDDAFAARGNRGQYLVVVPSRNVVIVRRGEDMVGTRFDIAAFTRDVLAALD